MAQLIVRNIEESVKRELRRRAKANGRSMEEEVRVILRSAAGRNPKKQEGLGTRLAKLFANVPSEFKIEEFRGGTPRIPDFDK